MESGVRLMKIKTRNRMTAVVSICALLLGLVYQPPVSASSGINCSDSRLTFNDILHWSPCSQVCESTGGAGSGGIGKNKDYRGDSVFSEAQMAAIKEYMPVYQEAAKEADIPWQLIAVMHARENGLSLKYPSNAQGLYQFFAKAGQYPTGRNATPEEFLAESIEAGEFLKGKVVGKEDALASGDNDTIKQALFGYNGRASVYKEQAIKLGFDQAGADRGEGSPYVMNKADTKRDPSYALPFTWGQIKIDRGPIVYPANQGHGAFVMYAALSDGVQTSSTCELSNVGTVTEGGLTEEQARKFMMNYGKNPGSFSSKAAGGLWSYCGGGGSNCVTFSAFFMTAFTEMRALDGTWGNGGRVVERQAASGAETGTEIRPFAVFSHKYSGGMMCGKEQCGHTGVVLGVHGDTVIVGHASCTRGKAGRRGEGDGTFSGSGAGYIRVGKIDDGRIFQAFGTSTDVDVTFAYPKSVDTDKINEFLSM